MEYYQVLLPNCSIVIVANKKVGAKTSGFLCTFTFSCFKRGRGKSWFKIKTITTLRSVGFLAKKWMMLEGSFLGPVSWISSIASPKGIASVCSKNGRFFVNISQTGASLSTGPAGDISIYIYIWWFYWGSHPMLVALVPQLHPTQIFPIETHTESLKLGNLDFGKTVKSQS